MAPKKLNIEAELKALVEEGPPLKLRKASFVGARLKVSVARFLEALFTLNEQLPKDVKLTDEIIKEYVRKEYSDHPTTVSYFAQKNPLASYRGKYNQGKILRSDPTASRKRYLSVPYNEEGVPVRNKRPMTKAEYLSSAANFGLGVELDANSGFVIHTTEHFGVVPKELFKLRANAKKSSKALAKA